MSFVSAISRHFIRLAQAAFCLLLVCCSGMVQAQVSVTATAGTAGPTTYTTLKAAIDAINLGTHQGAVTVSITASTTETAGSSLNASGSGGASYTRVRIQPGAGATPTVSGAVASGPLFKLNGASNVTINGSNNNTTSRDLTFSNTSTTGPQVVVIGSTGTASITADTLKNCILINGAQTSTAVIVGDAASPGTAGYFTNIGIQNNSIQKAYIGMYLTAVPGGTNGGGTLVSGNSLNSTGTNSIRLCGIYVQGVNGGTVSNNTIGNFEGVNPEFDRGIWLATGTSNTTITGNTVTGLSYTGATVGYAPIGINVSPGIANAAITVSGNTVTNISTASAGTATGIYFYTAASGITLERNQVSNIKNTSTGGYGAAGIYLVGGLTASAVNVINNFVWDVAGYGTNLWTADANGNGIVIDGGGGYNLYHNSVWLNTNQTATTGTRSAAVLITANVTAANSINLRNNLLVNTQTVGNANSRLALAVTAPTTVFNTFNYNNYYSTSGNLAGQGTNATLWSTVAQIQTNMGGNANSTSVQPTFASSTDLHLQVVAANAALNNTGVNLSTVPTDIDNDVRTTTPDMGADEFGNCLAVTYTTQPAAAAICFGRDTSFTVAATNATSIQWQVNTGSGFVNITNGGVYSGATSPTLTIAGAPVSMSGYTYRAQASYSALCPTVASNTALLTVNPRPSAAVTAAGPTTFCTGSNVTLSVATGASLQYQWRNGTTALAGATAASYTTATAGSFSAIVTNAATGCADTTVPPVVVTVGTGPAATVTPSGAASFCQGGSLVLSAGTTPGVSYEWQRNGVVIAGATANTYTATQAGSYAVTVSTSSVCKTLSSPTAVTVNPLPTASVTTFGSPILCQGGSVLLSTLYSAPLAYQWLRDGTVLSGATTFDYTASTAGQYRVQVVNTTTGCKDTSAPLAVVVNPLPSAVIAPTAPAAICEGTTTLLAANTGIGFGYQWYLDGASLPGATAATLQAALNGAYTVRVTDANGCQKTSTAVPLTVYPAPPAHITYSSPLQFCAGSAVVLSAFPAPGLTYQWLKDGIALPGVTALTYTVSDPGVYTVQAQNTFNCSALSQAVPVVVYAKPEPVISFVGGQLRIDAFATYQWYYNSNPVANGGTVQTLTPTQNGAYKVTVTDSNGCEGTSGIFFLNNVGVGGSTVLQAGILVYPNPAVSYILVDNRTPFRLKTLTLISATGAVVHTQPAAGGLERLELGELPAGVYSLRLETDGGIQVQRVTVLR